MALELNVNRLVRVNVVLSPLAAQRRSFGVLCVAGNSAGNPNQISNSERIRFYTDMTGVGQDFLTTAPEYTAAGLYFSQTPKPEKIAIGRWASAAYAATLTGGALTAAEQTLANWTSITAGAFNITINGTPSTITGVNFSTATSLSGAGTSVMSLLDTALTNATVSFSNGSFVLTSTTTGAASTITYGTGTGTLPNDLSLRFKFTQATALAIGQGAIAETPAVCATSLMNASGAWYGLMFASLTAISDAEYNAVSAVIQPATPSRIFGITSGGAGLIDSTVTNDIASTSKASGYTRTLVQYSLNPYAAASLFGKALSVNYNANRSTINLMYKQQPGVTPEGLSETQAGTLKTKRCNVFAKYNNDTSIIQYGVMSAESYIDERTGLDWFSDALQNAEYNLLYQSKRKIPQTDAGQHQLVTVAAAVCQEAVFNGLVAPGQWNADGFGQLERGDFLSEGYYIFTAPMASQDQSIREARVAPPITIALKLAGAINEIDITVDVNR
jgi:hypothetical protein